MIVNHDHATLFVAPSAPPDVRTARVAAAGPGGAEAMRRLRHPFAIQAAWERHRPEPRRAV